MAEKLNILINDTSVGATVLNVERTEQSAPQLTYNGGDDEFQPIIASQLTFNILVDDAADAKFIHLLTGNETRYEVQLEDADTNLVLWRGHLLPDQYSEPYENGALFVQFTATDGLGRLKNKYLDDTFYKQVKTIPEIIAACLLLTGNSFNLIMAPAITNAAATIIERDKQLKTTLFLDNKKKLNAYEILEKLMVSLGCTVFQHQYYWYVVGINRKNDLNVPCEYYTIYGGYIYLGEDTAFTRSITSVVFEGKPSITAIPPFKTVEIDWDKQQRDTIFPKEYVYQDPAVVADNADYTLGKPLFWEQTGTDFTLNLGYENLSASVAETDTNEPYFINLQDTTIISDVSAKYITLPTGVYIPASVTRIFLLNVDIAGKLWLTTDPTTYVDDGDFERKILFEITNNGDTILSNKTTFDVDDEFKLDLSVGEAKTVNGTVYYPISFSLKVENIKVYTAGYINAILHPALSVSGLNYESLVYSKIDITYTDPAAEDVFTKNRTIDYTTKKEVQPAFGFERNNLIQSGFSLNENVHITPYDIVIPADELTVTFQDYQIVDATAYGYGLSYFINITEEIYYKLVIGYNLYRLESNGAYTPINSFIFNEVSGGVTNYTLWIFDTVVGAIAQSDTLVVKQLAETITINTDDGLLNSWKRVGVTENASYPEVLARLYHSTVRETKFKIEGTVFGLVWPLDVLQFRFLAPKNYNISSLNLNLSEGTTDVVLIESVNKEIIDYE